MCSWGTCAAAGCTAAALFCFALPVRANNVLLTTSGCSTGCTTSPFGMVDIQQDIDLISLDVTVTLDSDAGGQYHFHKAPDPNHYALAFHIEGNPSVTISNLTTGFDLADTLPGTFSASPFGDFEYALKCTGCGAGYAGGLAGPLSFTVTPATGALTPNNLTPPGATHFFSVDIVDSLGNSGNVGDPGDPAPEPATDVMLGSALLVFGVASKRWQRSRRR